MICVKRPRRACRDPTRSATAAAGPAAPAALARGRTRPLLIGINAFGCGLCLVDHIMDETQASRMACREGGGSYGPEVQD